MTDIANSNYTLSQKAIAAAEVLADKMAVLRDGALLLKSRRFEYPWPANKPYDKHQREDVTTLPLPGDRQVNESWNDVYAGVSFFYTNHQVTNPSPLEVSRETKRRAPLRVRFLKPHGEWKRGDVVELDAVQYAEVREEAMHDMRTRMMPLAEPTSAPVGQLYPRTWPSNMCEAREIASGILSKPAKEIAFKEMLKVFRKLDSEPTGNIKVSESDFT